MSARWCSCALERAQPQPSGATSVPALGCCNLACQRHFPVCRAHEPRSCQPGGQQPLLVDARLPRAGLLGRFLGRLPAPAWPSGRLRQLAGGGHHLAARCHDAVGRHQLLSQLPRQRRCHATPFFSAESGQLQVISFFIASSYLAAVFSITSRGKRGAGGVLSQGLPLIWAVSSQSRKNCLS